MSYSQEYGRFQLGWAELGVPPFPLVPVQLLLTDGVVSAAGSSNGSVRANVTNSRTVQARVVRNGIVNYHPATEDGILVGSI